MTRPLLLLALAVPLLAACDKMPMNGALDGMWQLLTEEKTDTTLNVKDSRIYISFQLHTVQFDAHGTTQQYYATFTRHGDTLAYSTICHPASYVDETDDNELATADDLADLSTWGIYSLEPVYTVLQLTHESLVLQSDSSTLRLRKF